MEYIQLLKTAFEDTGLDFDEMKYKQFIDYMRLLQEWNEKINLTSIVEDELVIKKHFIDSFKIFKFELLKGNHRIIDVGTGAGFPGIPMKIADSRLNVTLLDSLNKRVNFLNEVIGKLKLNNILAVHGRAEDFAREKSFRQSFDFAVSRAVAALPALSEYCLPFVKVNGYFVALKGPSVEEEINESRNAISVLGGKLEEIIKIDIEDTDLKHNIVVIRKTKDTPVVYPRKAGIISKKPIK